MINLPLKCKCGAVRGTVEYSKKSDVKRFVCLCGDCQTFPQFLGNPELVLDRNGGTEIIPAYHWRIRFTAGAEQLRSVRLSSDGLLRWYTGCCKTPVGNSVSGRMPYMGLTHTILDIADREREFGPIEARLWGAHGIGELPPGTHQKAPTKFLFYVAGFILKAAFARRGAQSPFFKTDGEPVSAPTVLSDDEYMRLRAKTGSPWRA